MTRSVLVLSSLIMVLFSGVSLAKTECEKSRQDFELDFVDLTFDFCSMHVFVSKNKGSGIVFMQIVDPYKNKKVLQKILIREKTHEEPMRFQHGQGFIVKVRYSQTKAKLGTLLLNWGRAIKKGKYLNNDELSKIKWTNEVEEIIILK